MTTLNDRALIRFSVLIFSGLGPENSLQRTVVQSPLPDPDRFAGGGRDTSPRRGHHHRLSRAVHQTGHGHVTVVRHDAASLHSSERGKTRSLMPGRGWGRGRNVKIERRFGRRFGIDLKKIITGNNESNKSCAFPFRAVAHAPR